MKAKDAKDAYILGVQDGATFCTAILRDMQISDDPTAILISKCFTAAAEIITRNIREIIEEMKKNDSEAKTPEA